MKHLITSVSDEFYRENDPNDLVWVEFSDLPEGDLLVHVGLYSDTHGENMSMVRLMQAWGELTRMVIDNGARLGMKDLPDAMVKAVRNLEEGKEEQVKIDS